MAAHPSGKLPLPTLVVTAYTAKQPKKSRSLAEKIDAKRTKDKLRAKTRINIGSAHAPWRKLRDGLGLALDSQLARLLLDTFEKFRENSSSQKAKKPKSAGAVGGGAAGGGVAGGAEQCPACGFILKVHDGEEQSIEVTLELEEQEEPVSEEEEEEEEEEDSADEWTPKSTHQKEIKAVEQSEEERGGQAESPQEQQLCPECGAFFVATHTCDMKNKVCVCSVCSRMFISEAALRVHRHTHSDTQTHTLTHTVTDTQQFLCKFCSLSFRTRVDKLAHELIHLKQKDFICHICASDFASEQAYIRHLLLHSGEKPPPSHCHHKRNHVLLQEEQQEHPEEHTEEPKGQRPPTGRRKGRPKRSPEELSAQKKRLKTQFTESQD